MPLKTRPPTGRVAWPLILLEGEEKAGKSYALAQASGSPRIGRSFMLDLGDGTMDEYAALGTYEILEHDGTWSSIMEQIRAAAAEPSDPSKPNLIGVDAGTPLWGLLKDRASMRARGSRSARAKLAQDPDAEIDVSMTYWNEAKDRWAELLRTLRTFPGIAVLTALGREVTKVDSQGQPTRETEWSVDIEKTTAPASSAWIRLRRPHVARLVGVRKLGFEIPRDGLALPDENLIDFVVFEILGSGQDFGDRSTPDAGLGMPPLDAKLRLVEAIRATTPTLQEGEVKTEAVRLWALAGLDGKPEVSPAALEALLGLVGKPAQMPQEPPEDSGAPDAPSSPPEPQGDDQGATTTASAAWREANPDAIPLDARTISDMAKRDLVRELSSLGLPTNGTVGDLRLRLIEATAPFEPPETQEAAQDAADLLGGAFPGAELDPEPAALHVVEDVPEGWAEDLCFCGEPVMYDPKAHAATVRHLDPTLDKEHAPDVPF